MKRIAACILVIMLCFSGALAVPGVPYDPSTLLRYNQQTPVVRELVDLMYTAVMCFETEVEMPPNTAYRDAETAIDVLRLEFPELFHLDSSVKLRYYQNQPDVCTAVIFSYVMDESTYRSLYTQMLDAAIWFMPTGVYDPFDVTLHLHDALAARTVYPDVDRAQYNHEAYGALLYGSSVCEGYAHALTFLCRMAGIPCTMVTGVAYANGRTESHAWNVVELNGELFLTDCTFDDRDTAGETLHWYLNVPAADLATHVPDEQEFSISSSRQYTYHTRMNSWVYGEGDMERVFLEQVELHRRYGYPIELRFASADLFWGFIDNLGYMLGDAGIEHVQYTKNEELLIITVYIDD